MSFLMTFFIIFTFLCLWEVASKNLSQTSISEELYEIFMGLVGLTILLVILAIPFLLVVYIVGLIK